MQCWVPREAAALLRLLFSFPLAPLLLASPAPPLLQLRLCVYPSLHHGLHPACASSLPPSPACMSALSAVAHCPA